MAARPAAVESEKGEPDVEPASTHEASHLLQSEGVRLETGALEEGASEAELPSDLLGARSSAALRIAVDCPVRVRFST